MKLVSLFFFAGALLSAAPITQVTLTNAGNPAVDDGQYYVSPYTLTINGSATPAMCVDFLDESAVGNTWSAYISAVGGDISHTYHPDDAVQYEEEAYLFSLITQPNADRVDIQHAAWSITDPGYVANSAAQSYVTLAQANYKTINFADYELISSTGNPHEQEYLVASPEPSSIALFGTGLLLAGFGILRKKSKRTKRDGLEAEHRA